MNNHIAIIGAGRIGKALSGVITSSGNEVRLWDKKEGAVPNQRNISEIINGADAIFLCVPSAGLREACALVKEYAERNTFIISLTKGIERGTGKTADVIIGEFFSKKQFGILGGPLLAEELERDFAGAGVLGCGNEKIFLTARELFGNSRINLIRLKDVQGVALSGVLKNVYSLAFGVADGLGWGDNAKGWLLSKAIGEIPAMVKMLGGKAETALGAAGLGDLAACGFSGYSHNRQAGEDVLLDGVFDEQTEGVVSAPSVFSLIGRNVERFEILSALREIIENKRDPKDVFQDMFKRGK